MCLKLVSLTTSVGLLVIAAAGHDTWSVDTSSVPGFYLVGGFLAPFYSIFYLLQPVWKQPKSD